MIKLSYDLHIHSCLSPCADEDMTPTNIVGMAALKELAVIAVTDHNSCRNCPAVLKLAAEYGILAIPGMELTTREEVHVLCLFRELSHAMRFNEYVYSQLMKVANDVRIFGSQLICDEAERVIEEEPYLLINATDISFDDLGSLMEEYHGIYIPAHLDRSSNSLLSNLGFIPPEAGFTAAELADLSMLKEISRRNPYLKQCRIITNSDAHSLGHINEAVNDIYCKSNNMEDIFEALTAKPVEQNDD